MKGDVSDSKNSPLPLSAYKEHQNHMLHKVVKGVAEYVLSSVKMSIHTKEGK
jgi:hypothetical protein